MTRTKYTSRDFAAMIERFECDFNLAAEGESLADIQELIDKKDPKIMSDIDMLGELSFLLRSGYAEIVAKDSPEEEQNAEKQPAETEPDSSQEEMELG